MRRVQSLKLLISRTLVLKMNYDRASAQHNNEITIINGDKDHPLQDIRGGLGWPVCFGREDACN